MKKKLRKITAIGLCIVIGIACIITMPLSYKIPTDSSDDYQLEFELNRLKSSLKKDNEFLAAFSAAIEMHSDKCILIQEQNIPGILHRAEAAAVHFREDEEYALRVYETILAILDDPSTTFSITATKP